jgi:S1-C subfamily serine protease
MEVSVSDDQQPGEVPLPAPGDETDREAQAPTGPWVVEPDGVTSPPPVSSEPETEPIPAAAPAAAAPPWTPPPAPAPAPVRSGGDRPARGLRQFLLGALVGGVTAALVASGVYVAVDDDSGSTPATVQPSPTVAPSRNTSVIAQPRDVQEVLAKVEPAVVAITTGGAVDNGLFSGNGGESGGAGTGFVISADGVIVTNNHVVEDSGGRIEVQFTDGTKLAAKILGRSPDVDLAVLKVDAKNLPTAKLGDSNALQVGDDVVAIGNALALEGGLSVTQGIISAKDRTVPTETGATLYNVLQTDAAINPGNSGGPLVNSKGEVVGINTAIANPSEAQNVGFAISISSAKDIIDQLAHGQSVRLAFLGVATQTVTPAIARELGLQQETGAVIVRVTSDSGADKAGLKRDDVIVKIGDRVIRRSDDVGAAVRNSSPGDKISVTYERDGSEHTVDVTLGARPN